MIALSQMVRKHRSAFGFDCLDRFGLPLSGVRGLPCSDAYAALSGLTRDPRTHVYAALTKQTFQGSQADMAVILLAQAVLNIGRTEGKPIRLMNPYFGADKKKARAQYVPPKEKQQLTERLRTYSSIPD